jgi:hypothetical protein
MDRLFIECGRLELFGKEGVELSVIQPRDAVFERGMGTQL